MPEPQTPEMIATFQQVMSNLKAQTLAPHLPEHQTYKQIRNIQPVIDTKAFRERTKIAVTGNPLQTTLADHFADDGQLHSLLAIGAENKIISPDLLREVQVDVNNPAPLDHLKRAKILAAFVRNLHGKVGNNHLLGEITTLINSQDVKRVSGDINNPFNANDVIDALMIAGQEELAKWFEGQPEKNQTVIPTVTPGASRGPLTTLAELRGVTPTPDTGPTNAADAELKRHIEAVKQQLTDELTPEERFTALAVLQALAQDVKNNPHFHDAQKSGIARLKNLITTLGVIAISQVPGGSQVVNVKLDEAYPHVPGPIKQIIELAEMLDLLPEMKGIKAIILYGFEDAAIGIESMLAGLRGTKDIAKSVQKNIEKLRQANEAAKRKTDKEGLVDLVGASYRLNKAQKVAILDRLVDPDKPLSDAEIKQLKDYFKAEADASTRAPLLAENLSAQILKKPLALQNLAQAIGPNMNPAEIQQAIDQNPKVKIDQRAVDFITTNIRLLKEQTIYGPFEMSHMEGINIQRMNRIKTVLQTIPQLRGDDLNLVASQLLKLNMDNENDFNRFSNPEEAILTYATLIMQLNNYK